MAANAPRTIAAPNDFEDIPPSQILDDFEDIPPPAPSAAAAAAATAPMASTPSAQMPPASTAEMLTRAGKYLAPVGLATSAASLTPSDLTSYLGAVGGSIPIAGPLVGNAGTVMAAGLAHATGAGMEALGVKDSTGNFLDSKGKARSWGDLYDTLQADKTRREAADQTAHPAAHIAAALTGGMAAVGPLAAGVAPGAGAAAKVGTGLINAGMVGELYRNDARARGADEPTAEKVGNQAAVAGLLSPALDAAGPAAQWAGTRVPAMAEKAGRTVGGLAGAGAGAYLAHGLNAGPVAQLAEALGGWNAGKLGAALGGKAGKAMGAGIAKILPKAAAEAAPVAAATDAVAPGLLPYKSGVSAATREAGSYLPTRSGAEFGAEYPQPVGPIPFEPEAAFAAPSIAPASSSSPPKNLSAWLGVNPALVAHALSQQSRGP